MGYYFLRKELCSKLIFFMENCAVFTTRFTNSARVVLHGRHNRFFNEANQSLSMNTTNQLPATESLFNKSKLKMEYT
jgi:hypothetical protein